jgi:hypothetical protein
VTRSIRAALRGLLALLVSATPVAAQPALEAGQPVIALSFRGTHRAYPLTLFSDRRVVNDVIESMEIAVFHSPELGVSAAWFRTVLGEPIEFSGEAAGAVADDLTTITRWDLTTGVAVAGNLEGQRLVSLPATLTSWDGWAALHPNAGVYSGGEP